MGITSFLVPRATAQVYSRGQSAMAISIAFTSLAIVAVLVRLYTRLRLIRNAGSDDYTIVASLVFSILFMVFFIGEVDSGLGRHMSDLTIAQQRTLFKNFYLTLPMYYCTIFLTKVSMIFQFFRIVPNDFHRLTFWVTLGVLVVYSLWTIISAALICMPVAHFWDSSVPGHCLNRQSLWFSNAILNIFADIWVLLLPVPAIYKLQLPSRQKIAIMMVFIVGGFVCVTSILRLTTLASIANSKDPSWDNVGAASWSAIEANTGIICACLPALKPLLIRMFPHILSTHSNTSRPYGRGTTLRQTTRGFRQSNANNFQMYTIDVDSDGTDLKEYSGMDGIKVTTEVVQARVQTSEDSESLKKLTTHGS